MKVMSKVDYWVNGWKIVWRGCWRIWEASSTWNFCVFFDFMFKFCSSWTLQTLQWHTDGWLKCHTLHLKSKCFWVLRLLGLCNCYLGPDKQHQLYSNCITNHAVDMTSMSISFWDAGLGSCWISHLSRLFAECCKRQQNLGLYIRLRCLRLLRCTELCIFLCCLFCLHRLSVCVLRLSLK